MLVNKVIGLFRWIKKRWKSRRLKNSDFSIIASNCNGGVIVHDLHQQFRSPFVNLWILPGDFIRLLSSFDDYMEQELSFVKEDGIDYPVAMLKDVKIFFQHYSSEAEAREKWNKRKSRINKSNMFVMFTDRDGCTYQDLEQFDSLPYAKKVVFTKQEYPDIKSAYYIKGFENQESVGKLGSYKSKTSLNRYLDDFDYISWLNDKGKK